MKCAYHNDVDAVATCNICGVSLCSTCASMIKPPQCIGCYRDSLVNRRNDIRNSLIKDVLFAIVAVIICFYIMPSAGSSFGKIFLNVLLFAGIPFGWNFLNKITPNIFLFLPMVGWLIYFLCKLSLSMLVGIFVAPYVIWKKSKEMKQLQHSIDDVANMDNKSLVVGQ